MNRSKTFGSFLREVRISRQKTLKEVADHMGWSIVYLSDIERERRNPPKAEDLRKLSVFLGIEEKNIKNAIDIQRQRVELDIRPDNSRVTDAALLLARRWTGVTEEQAENIIKLLEGKVD